MTAFSKFSKVIVLTVENKTKDSRMQQKEYFVFIRATLSLESIKLQLPFQEGFVTLKDN